MINSRDLRDSDIKAIDDIFKKQPGLGVPSTRNMVVNGIVEKDGKLLAYGVVKLFGEASLIVDNDISKKDKAKVIREVMNIAILASRGKGLEYLYLISNSDSFSDVLRKSYGFINCPGQLLMLDLEGDDNG